MKPSALFDLSLRHKPWRAGHMRWLMQDLAGVARQPEQDHRTHLRASLEWTCRAQDTCQAVAPGVVPAGWAFEHGWLPADIDVTGRLIETFLPAADYLAWPVLTDRAIAMHEALLARPSEGGTGRLHGLVAGHLLLRHGESLDRAVTSARAWPAGVPGATLDHAEAAHALAAVGSASGDRKVLEAARLHLVAAVSGQTPCGWFRGLGARAPTAAVARTTRALLEASRLLDDEPAGRAARRSAHGLRERLGLDGALPGAFDDGWMPGEDHVCITSLVQLACVWLRLAQLEQVPSWREAAWRALSWVKRSQRTEGDDLALRDALPNAVPIWGGRAGFRFDVINAKYFADALMMDMVGIAIPACPQGGGE